MTINIRLNTPQLYPEGVLKKPYCHKMIKMKGQCYCYDIQLVQIFRVFMLLGKNEVVLLHFPKIATATVKQEIFPVKSAFARHTISVSSV